MKKTMKMNPAAAPTEQKLTERQQQQQVVKWAQEHESKFPEPTAQGITNMCAIRGQMQDGLASLFDRSMKQYEPERRQLFNGMNRQRTGRKRTPEQSHEFRTNKEKMR